MSPKGSASWDEEPDADKPGTLEIGQEYLRLKGIFGTVDKQLEQDRGNFSVLSFLESLAGKSNVRSNIAYMRPQSPVVSGEYRETSVEIKIENVTLDQAVRFLSAIDKSPHVLKIKNLHFRTRYAEPDFLDVTVLLSAYEKAA